MSEEIKKELEEKVSEAKDEIKEVVSETSKKKGNKALLWFLLIIVVAVGAYFAVYKKDTLNSILDNISSKENPASEVGAVVATVNGVKITRDELDKKIEQVKKTLPEGAGDPTEDASFELQLLNEVINLKLLVDTAEKKNYVATDDQINAQRAIIVEQFGSEENLAAQLKTFGITEDELRENMKNEIMIKQLLSDETDIDKVVVTDEEVKQAYDNAIAGAEGAPAFEDISEMLRSQIKDQKGAGIVNDYIEKLKKESDIKITL